MKYFEEQAQREHMDDDEPFTDCGGGRRAMWRGCDCDACVNAADDEYHRRKDEGWY